MLTELNSKLQEQAATATFKLYTNEQEFLKLLQDIRKKDTITTIYLISAYTIKALQKNYSDIPSIIFKTINDYLRTNPSYFLYQTKFLLRLTEGKTEDAKEILKLMKKKYKSYTEHTKELSKLL